MAAADCSFWQEKDWNRFTDAHPEFAVGLDELAIALRICHLHGEELLPDTVPVFHGCLDYADSYIKAQIRLFPWAASDPWSTEGMPFDGERTDVWYCQACREAKAQWESERKTRPTSRG